MTYKVLAAALAVSIVTSPTIAKGTTDQKSQKAEASVDTQKYCIKFDDITGTRISRQECRTKKQWADEGVQVDRKNSS